MPRGDTSRNELEAGALIAGRFQLETTLGHGGMGDVYRVCEQRTGRRVALKRLRYEPGDTEKRERLASLFEREYHSLVQLSHPRIIEAHDYGVDGEGVPFYTMELLDGEDLQQRGKQPWRDACCVLLDVASALAMLHSRRLLHRDLSPRNVRCMADGRAKLIDFGALTPMGAVKTIAGTPISVPPEALERQLLDARADLYALGVLAYWMLTGRYPYAVRAFAELSAAWLNAPPSVAQLAPDVPFELDRLVMELLHLDRMARPASAAEVMERLSGIAGVSLTEHARVPISYLVTPPLVGRAELLAAAHAKLRLAYHGEANAIVIEGEDGSGRSRMLAACTLEARLMGMTVLRGDASDSAAGEYGLVRALCAQLFELLPEAASRAGAAQSALLAHVCPGLAAEPPIAPSVGRARLQAALLELWRTVARDKPLVIAVDDADDIDEPSAAVLAAVVHRSEPCNIAVVLTRCSREPADGALSFVRESALVLALAPFEGEQTEALLRAVFGSVQHVVPVAACVHALSNGNPQRVMALAEHLVTRGLAQYEAGGWTLPAAIGAAELPQSLSAQWRARIAALPPDARELADALALAEPCSLRVEDYPALLQHGDAGRSYHALDHLIAQGVVTPAANRHRLAQRELASALAAEISDERARGLHERIGRALELNAQPLLAVDHLLRAGNAAQAVQRLLALGKDCGRELSLRAVSLLEQAIGALPALDATAHQHFELCSWLTSAASVLGLRDVVMRHGLPLLASLERDSGLCDYLELHHLPESERVVVALGKGAARYEAAPAHARGPSPMEALTQLAKLCSGIANFALIAQDAVLLERLPSLQPLAALSPAFEVVELLTLSARDVQAGRIREANAKCARALARVERPDRAGLEPVLHQGTRRGLLYMQGVFAAAYGLPDAADWVADLEREPGHRAHAFRVHMAAALMRGDAEAAAAHQRRAELLELEDGATLRYRGSTARLELIAHVTAADVIGLKRAMERIESMHASYPLGWRPTLALARGCYLRAKGEPARALEVVRGGLQGISAGQHLDWALLAGNEAGLLSELGRHDEAIARARAAWEQHQWAGLSGTTPYLLQVMAEVLHGAGHHEVALDWANRAIACYESEGRRGLCLGNSYEVRARIAAALGHRDSFAHYARRCAGEYRRGQSSALTARYERLIRYAQQVGAHARGRVRSAAEWAADCASSGASTASDAAPPRSAGAAPLTVTSVSHSHGERGRKSHESIRREVGASPSADCVDGEPARLRHG